MDIALDGRKEHLGLRLGDPERLFVGFQIGLQIGHRFLHDAGALDHLRQKHLAGAEQVADDVHAIHQRPLDHLEGAIHFLPCFLGVLLDVVTDPLHQGMRQAFLDRALPPCELLDLLDFLLHLLLGYLDQPLGRVRIAIEDDVFDELSKLFIDLVVHLQLPRIDDGHVEAGLDGVVEENRVHRLANPGVAAERERQIADTARDLDEGKEALDLTGRIEEGDGVVVMLLHTRSNRQHVGIEDDVLRREADLLGQDSIGALGNCHLVLDARGLAGLVEAHHQNGGTVASDKAGLLAESFLALLEADRVDDALALKAFQPRLDHRELRAVDHDRQPGDVGLGGDQVEEGGHGRFGIEHPLVHVDIEDIRATGHLVVGNIESGLEISFLDQARELARAGNIGAFADHDQVGFRPDRQRLDTAVPRQRLGLGGHMHGCVRHRLDESGSVIRGRAAAGTGDIEPAVGGEFTQNLCHTLGRQIVFTKLVRQAGVRPAGNAHIGDSR